MIWLIQDFDLLSVLLRALTLALEALTVGGVFFQLWIATPADVEREGRCAAARLCRWCATALAAVQLLTAAVSCAMLMGSGLPLREVVTADFFFADLAIAAGALLLFLLLRFSSASLRRPALAALLIVFGIVSGSVALSHSVARLEHRAPLVLLTAAHHLGTAAWIGAMPFLLIALRRGSDAQQMHALARRFSRMALAGAAVLVMAGLGMAYFYVGAWQGLYGTSYGVMLLAKIYLLALVLALGTGNFFLLRGTRQDATPVLARLRRVSEAEIGLGFTLLLVAASLTSQPPAADTQPLARHEITERLAWRRPSLTTPSFAQLSPRGSLKETLESASFTGGAANDAMDRWWSEYNHHWAGILVLAAGVFALAARIGGERSWFRNWPLLFLGLAVFLVLRADADAWPLGPRSFWGSFAEAEVLEHRVFAMLIAAFAIFEWAVETGRVQSRWAALVFPALCALGGALLMTHSHSLGAAKEETLAEMSHTSIALLGVTAGWSRWLQLRLPGRENSALATRLQWLWPVCLALAGIILLNYRES